MRHFLRLPLIAGMAAVLATVPGLSALAADRGDPQQAADAKRAADEQGERAWLATYDARQRFYETAFGPLPKDILKMLNMTGVWPGGGLYVIPAKKLGADLAVYTTFGLSNTDMPTSVRMRDHQITMDGPKRPGSFTGQLEKREPAPRRPGAAGYGYELVVLARPDSEWALDLLQWTVNAEITRDAGLLARVEKYDGMTVEQVPVDGGSVNLLIAKARAPLPAGVALPSGRMDLLVATVITEEEMRWSMKNGRGALLDRLIAGGVGQVSRRDRASVVR